MTTGQPFEQRKDAEVPASPEEVWAAIATGPGIDSWFIGRNSVRPGPGGTVRTEFGDYAPELEITAWDPPRRFGYRSGQAPDGRFIAYEFLVEGRAGGSTVLRAVTSGFIPGEDWEDEYEAMALGGDLFFATLVEYLARFRGRFAVPVTVFGPPGTNWERDRRLIFRALGLPAGAAAGGKVRLTAAESGTTEGILYFVNASAIGVRTSGALYRFVRGFGKPVVASHQLFTDDADPERAARGWESWLARVLGATEQPAR
jgi:uncharacterized protein YndB with AHSA1/START domain